MTTLTANAGTDEAVRDAARGSLAAYANEPRSSYAESVSAIADSYADGRITARQRDILLALMLASLAEETLDHMVTRCFSWNAQESGR